MNFVTFNIRYDSKKDGLNCIENRLPLIKEKITEEKPVIIGFQEVLPHVREMLRREIGEIYGDFGRCRDIDEQDESVPIFYDKTRLELLSFEDFWLSPTPEVPGSQYPGQRILPRICTHGFFRDRKTGREFQLINTHFHHLEGNIRLLESRQLAGVLHEMIDARQTFFLCGDFNATPASEELAPLFHLPGLQSISAGVGGTFHDFGRVELKEIDLFFASEDVKCKCCSRWMDERNGIYLSDHYPVCCSVEF